MYLYRLLSFFKHRRQNQEFLIFTSKFEILLMRLKAAWMDLMPVFTAQSPSFRRQSVQGANARTIARHQQAASVRAPPPVLLNEDDPTVLRQYTTGMQDRQRDAFFFGGNLIAQFFIIQSELSDQQRERLASAMSLRNISLQNYSYEMLKTHSHELFITTRTSIQDPSIRPQGGNRSNEQGEHEGEEGLWVEDEEGLEEFMSNNDGETFWVLEENDAFIARKVSGRNFRFKKRKSKGSHQRGGFKPFRQSGSGGKANMANENYDPYDQAYWGKGKGKKGKKGKSKFQYPCDGNKGYPPYENGKGKGGHDKGKPKTFAAIAEKTEEQADPIRCSFRTQFVRRNKSQPFGNNADGACHQPSAQSDLCDPGQRMYQIHGQLACNPAFYSGHRTHEGHHLLSVHPGRDQVHFCKRRDRKVNWTLHLRYHTTPPCSTSITA